MLRLPSKLLFLSLNNYQQTFWTMICFGSKVMGHNFLKPKYLLNNFITFFCDQIFCWQAIFWTNNSYIHTFFGTKIIFTQFCFCVRIFCYKVFFTKICSSKKLNGTLFCRSLKEGVMQNLYLENLVIWARSKRPAEILK